MAKTSFFPSILSFLRIFLFLFSWPHVANMIHGNMQGNGGQNHYCLDKSLIICTIWKIEQSLIYGYLFVHCINCAHMFNLVDDLDMIAIKHSFFPGLDILLRCTWISFLLMCTSWCREMVICLNRSNRCNYFPNSNAVALNHAIIHPQWWIPNIRTKSSNSYEVQIES